MTTQDDLRRLEREFADAMQRMFTVGNGLARLRAALDDAATQPADAAAQEATTAFGASVPPVTVVTDPGPGGSAAGCAVPPGAPPAGAGARALPPRADNGPHATAPVGPAIPWYRHEGAVTRVLALAGAVITLAGVAMMLVIAVRAGWFGPQARVAAGALLAVVLGALGARGGARDRADRGTVGSAPVALVATGAAAAYLDVVAVSAAYRWVPAWVGLALCVLVALSGLGLARRWGSELLGVIMVLGAAALSPYVAGGAGWMLSAVLAVLALAGWWSGAGRRTPVLTLSSTTPVLLSLLVGAAEAVTPGERLGLLGVSGVVLLASIVSATVDQRRDRGDLTPAVAVGLCVVGMLAVTWLQREPLQTVAFAVTAAVLLLTATAAARAPLGPLPVSLVGTLASGGAVTAMAGVVAGAPQGYLGTGLLLLALAHVGHASMTRARVSLAVGGGVSVVAVLVWVEHAAAVLWPSVAIRHDLPVAFVDSALVAGLLVLLAWSADLVRGVPAALRQLARGAAWAVALAATTTAFVSVGTLLGLRLGSPELGFTVGHAVATLTWMVAAAALLLRSLDRPGRGDAALRGGLLIAGLAVAKLFLFDLASLDGVVRSVAFIGTGLLLLATGSRYARTWERTRAGV